LEKAVFEAVDTAEQKGLDEIIFDTETIQDVIDILTELAKYAGNEKVVEDFDNTLFYVNKIIYNPKEKRTFLSFTDMDQVNDEKL